MTLYRILDVPAIYSLSQRIFAWGAEAEISRQVLEIQNSMPYAKGTLLDLGCGPKSWITQTGVAPVGLDLNFEYMKAYSSATSLAVVASATAIPFPTECFAGVWSVGLLHHVEDVDVTRIIEEAFRVCRAGGYVAIFDAVKPERLCLRPLATLIRKCDRGKFMRTESELKALLSNVHYWNFNRVTYSLTGLEMLICTARKS